MGMQRTLQNDATHNTTWKEALMTVTDFVSERFVIGTSSGVVSIKELMGCVVFCSMCAVGAVMIFIWQWRWMVSRCMIHPTGFGRRCMAMSWLYEKPAVKNNTQRRTRFSGVIAWNLISDMIQPDRLQVCQALCFPVQKGFRQCA